MSWEDVASWVKEIYRRLTESSKYTMSANEGRDLIKLFDEKVELDKRVNTNPSLADNPEYQEFIKKHFPKEALELFDKYTPKETEEGTIEFISKTDSDEQIKETQAGLTQKLDSAKIWVWGVSKTAYSFEDIENKKPKIPDEIKDMLKFLDATHLGLLRLSVESEYLHNQNRHDDADNIRFIIRKQYDKYGLKFCNLYTSGYLKSFFRLLLSDTSKLTKESCVEEIKDFVNRQTNGIFFINRYMDTDNIRISIKVNELLRQGKGYVAIHSTRLPQITNEIIKNIDNPSKPYIIMRTANKKWRDEFIRVWFYGTGGEKLFDMIKEYHSFEDVEFRHSKY